MQTADKVAKQGPGKLHTAISSVLPLMHFYRNTAASAVPTSGSYKPGLLHLGMEQQHKNRGQQHLQELEHCRKVCLLGEAGLLQVVKLVQATTGDLLLTYIYRIHAMQT